MVDAQEFERWRSEAGRALHSARLQSREELQNWACFLAEQAAQLAVKALLHGLGRAPWGHDLAMLARMLEEAGVAPPSEMHEVMLTLSRYYIATRYPDAHAAGAAGDHYTARDARAALEDAERTLAWVDDTWRSLQ